MEIINKMNELIRKDLRDVKMNMDLFDREIISIKANIDSAVKELQKLQDKINQNNTKYKYVFRCIKCKQNHMAAYPEMGRAELISQGYTIIHQ